MAWTDNLYKEEIDQKIDKIVSSAQLVGKGYFTQFLSLSEDSRRPWQQRFLLPKRKQQRPSLMHSESLKEQSLDKKTKG